MRRAAVLPGLIAVVVLFSSTGGRANEARLGGGEDSPRLDALFPQPPGLAKRVRFWTKVFTAYSENQVVFHDARHVEKVYAILSLDPGITDKDRAIAVEAEKNRIRGILLDLDEHADDAAGRRLGREARKIFELLRDVKETDKFGAAADRVRAQTGLRDRFKEGIRVSRRYLPEMSRIFREAGLPVELTRLPLIESCFEVRAASWRGAVGVWQFMPATARLHGLRVDHLIDERRDPILATRAAAGYLASAYRRLGSWPLAITAYNHGIEGIARAVRSVGSHDVAELVERYEGPGFGFAGRNFYAEFLASVTIDRRPEEYFGDLMFEDPLLADGVRLPHALGIQVAARAADVPTDAIVALNPALGSRIVAGASYLPRGYVLRLPPGTKAEFERRVSALAGRRAAPGGGSHRVQRGQTLSHIARHYGVSLAALERYNRIRDPNHVRVGQVIKIPNTRRRR